MTSFFVAGKPVPQGSKRAIPRQTSCGKIHVALIEMGKGLKGWRAAIKRGAVEAGLTPLDGPVGVDLTFFMQRPASHHVAGSHDRPLKDSAPIYPCGRVGDLDKLTRAVLDGLDGVAYHDDAQVCMFGKGPIKVYGLKPGVEISVYTMLPGGV